MLKPRHSVLGLALVAAGLAAGGTSVLADDEHEVRRELHHVRHDDPVVIDRFTTLHRLDHLLEGIDDLALLVLEDRPGRGHGRRLVDDGAEELRRGDDDRDGDDAERERPGARPDERVELHRVPPPARDRLAERRLDELRRELLALRRDVLRAPEVVRAPRRPLPLDDNAFRRFLGDLHRAPFARDKVALVEDVALHAHFTSEQARVVVCAVEAWGQVEAAVALYPRVVDPESFHVVITAVTFASDRAELRRLIRD